MRPSSTRRIRSSLGLRPVRKVAAAALGIVAPDEHHATIDNATAIGTRDLHAAHHGPREPMRRPAPDVHDERPGGAVSAIVRDDVAEAGEVQRPAPVAAHTLARAFPAIAVAIKVAVLELDSGAVR
jgi:hypothetical protein